MIREMRFLVTMPAEASARAVADRLAERGHLLVAVRPVPDTPLHAADAGCWNVHSLVVDPPYDGPLEMSRPEVAAVSAVARRHGGRARGACGRHPDEAIARFSRDGLVHELNRADADRIRERIVATQAVPAASLPPAPGLRCGSFRLPGTERRAVAAVLRAAGAGWADRPAAGDVLAGIADEAFPQGTCVPATAGAVPVLAALAAARGVGEFFRAIAVMVLFQIGTAGRRGVAGRADGPVPDPGETADEVAARAAVAAVLPDLVAGVRGGELVRFLLAGLCAAVPEGGTGLPAGLDPIGRRYAGTARAPVVALIRAVAAGDPERIRAAEADVAAALPDVVDLWQSPAAAPADRALDTLNTVLQSELDRPRMSPAGRAMLLLRQPA